MKAIYVNGEPRQTAAQTVRALLEELGLHDRRVAVMVNGQIVKRAEFEKAGISESNQVEIISLIGGG